MEPSKKGRVTRIEGTGIGRQRLLDMGSMPNLLIELDKISPGGDPIWIRFQGTEVSLKRKEAKAVVVVVD